MWAAPSPAWALLKYSSVCSQRSPVVFRSSLSSFPAPLCTFTQSPWYVRHTSSNYPPFPSCATDSSTPLNYWVPQFGSSALYFPSQSSAESFCTNWASRWQSSSTFQKNQRRAYLVAPGQLYDWAACVGLSPSASFRSHRYLSLAAIKPVSL